MKYKLLLFLSILLTFVMAGYAQEEIAPDTTAATDSTAIPPPAPISLLEASDAPNDHGHAIELSWEISPDDGGGQNSVLTYEVFRWKPFLIDTLTMMRQQIDKLLEVAITLMSISRGLIPPILVVCFSSKTRNSFA